MSENRVSTFQIPFRPTTGDLIHLDFTRFIAAFGIVLAHSLEFYFTPSTRKVLLGMTAGLPLFVDVFFVISGFIISLVYSGRLHTAFEYGRFMKRRVGRIVPLHILLFFFWLLFYIGIAHTKVPMKHPSSLSPSCLLTTGLLLQSFVHCGGESINGITWSISAEMVMYTAFPVFLLFARRLDLLVMACLAALALALWQIGGIRAWTGAENVARALPAFLFGVILFKLRFLLARIPAPAPLLCVALLLLLAGGLTGWPMPLLLPLAYVVPLLAIAADTRDKAPALIRRMAPLGQLTYSLYMIHPVLILIVMNAAADKVLHLGPVPMIAIGVTTYAALLLVSWASFRFYETPLRRWIDGMPLFNAEGDTLAPSKSDKAKREL